MTDRNSELDILQYSDVSIARGAGGCFVVSCQPDSAALTKRVLTSLGHLFGLDWMVINDNLFQVAAWLTVGPYIWKSLDLQEREERLQTLAQTVASHLSSFDLSVRVKL